ncbi:hypothetical protein [Dactylosporangium sp. NPDC005555]|uniref:hypothetical protein n=1 Tax=Dactylosporangium sp. NPDC005555 TaxID=3154889 RepID=UPI0033A89151
MSIQRALVFAAAVVLALAGCDGSPAPAASGQAAATACGGAVAAEVQQRIARPGVQSVTVDKDCVTLVVGTTLSDGDADAARQLCDLAATTAYAGGIIRVRVDSGAGKDLARGVKGSRCG